MVKNLWVVQRFFKVNGGIIDYSIFGEVSLNDELMAKCDLFIFWNERWDKWIFGGER